MNPTWLQPDWYVSWSTGNDANDGTTPATAVKTVMGGIVIPWGTSSPTLPQNTTIHMLDSQPLGAENIDLSPTMGGTFYFAIVGTLIAIGTPTVFGTGSVTSKNRSTGQALAVSGLSTSYTPGRLVKNQTHPSSAWVRKNVSGTVTFSQPLTTVGPGDPVFTAGSEVDTWADSDTVQLYDVPTINLTSCVILGGAVNSGLTASALWIQDLHVLDASGGNDTSCFAPSCDQTYTALSEVWVDPYLLLGGNPSFCNAFNCYMNGGGEMQLTAVVNGGVFTSNNTGFLFDLGCSLDQDVAVDGFVEAGDRTSLGLVEISSTGEVFVAGSAYLAPLTSSSIVWGAGALNPGNGGHLHLVSGTFAAVLLGPLVLRLDNTATTGTSYASGVWTDGITLTPANLDTNAGLQNPRTGSKFALT